MPQHTGKGKGKLGEIPAEIPEQGGASSSIARYWDALRANVKSPGNTSWEPSLNRTDAEVEQMLRQQWDHLRQKWGPARQTGVITTDQLRRVLGDPNRQIGGWRRADAPLKVQEKAARAARQAVYDAKNKKHKAKVDARRHAKPETKARQSAYNTAYYAAYREVLKRKGSNEEATAAGRAAGRAAIEKWMAQQPREQGGSGETGTGGDGGVGSSTGAHEGRQRDFFQAQLEAQLEAQFAALDSEGGQYEHGQAVPYASHTLNPEQDGEWG
ncbi:hypothetical protein ccbrp13_70940 [Ktedonobacteria bacterium brp13]|nr:hypothetical protein ccbrp13_70940 [Ktedonobacteria bacterium brp13]